MSDSKQKKINDYEEWAARLLANNVSMAVYKCPDCKTELYAQIPDSGQYDSMVFCPYCEELHFKVVNPDGSVEVS